MLDSSARRLYLSFIWGCTAIVAVMLIGTVGYRLIGGEQYSWIDCFYMTFITIATIGFGEVVDVSSPSGRIFTIVIGFAGIAAMSYLLSTVTAFILESDLNQAWRSKRMLKKIDKLSGHFIVCGIGRVGGNVAQELTKTGRVCVIVDEDQGHLDTYLLKHPDQMYLHGDATDNEVLLAAGIERAKGVFAVAADDSKNLVISLSAKQLNPHVRVVARCHDVKNEDKTRRAGADEIVSPDFTGGLRIVSAMIRPQVLSFLDEMTHTEENLRMEEIVIPTVLSGHPLSVLYHGEHDCVVLAVRSEGSWLFNPQASFEMSDGDVLMVMTTPEGRQQVERLLTGEHLQ